jgi:8-amino-7-oxononanoate synthase
MSRLPYSTLVELAHKRANQTPDTLAYTFIVNEDEEEYLTYAQVDQRARAIAATLIDMNLQGERALLLYMPGLDYLTAFFGCLYAGVVAVPAYPPDPERLNRTLPRLLSIVKDSQAAVIMSTSVIEGLARNMFASEESHTNLRWISTDTVGDEVASSWKMPKQSGEALAFLQYTSGSTSNPRGVMLTHNNLYNNLALIDRSLPYGDTPSAVSWLPPYHDMGLIGGILQPMHGGFHMTLLSPLEFLTNPFAWLKALSDKKATASAGPNFAYDLCVRRVTPEERDTLDLSNWRVAVNGAEPVRLETMERFYEHFAPAGFHMETFFPCYGLAETALYVCGGSNTLLPSSTTIDAASLEKGVIEAPKPNEPSRILVGCGKATSDQELYVVNPKTCEIMKDDHVGEIWLKHGSVAQGYWGHPKKTQETFGGYLAPDKRGPFLRTGDLGFMRDGELFLTGRQKDMIIVRGRNHYPQDIEQTLEDCHENVRPGCVAAFSTKGIDNEALAVVVEVKRSSVKGEIQATIDAISNAVFAEHGLRVEVIALIKSKAIPKTSSGKIQRHACKEMMESATLEAIKIWRFKPGAKRVQPPAKKPPIKASFTELRHVAVDKRLELMLPMIKERVAQVLGLDADAQMDVDDPLVQFGLDSLMRQELIGSLERLIEHSLANLTIDEKTSTRSLTIFLANHPSFWQHKQVGTTTPTNQQVIHHDILPEYTQFDLFPSYVEVKEQLKNLDIFGLRNPFFTEHEGLVRDTTKVDGKTLINFSNYNYIGMAGHPGVSAAAKEAIDRYGTSVSASRLVSGERPLHTALEKRIAAWVGVEDSIVFVSGHATNVSTIGHLFGPGDLIVHDSLSHNSILQGCQLSGAKAIPFPHNDWQSLDRILTQQRSQYKRALVIIEGIYSMDGDIPDLAKYIDIKRRHHAFLMVDEAHSVGVLGKTGRGLAEHADVSPQSVDLWMGTLSKSFASCGGYIAGCKAVVDYLRDSAPGFVYSVGISPPNAAASLAAIDVLEKEPDRVETLKHNSNLFLNLCKENKLDTGMSALSPIVPIIIGNSMQTLMLSENMLKEGVNVRPIIYPAVEDKFSRLRFFITSCHSDAQIKQSVKSLAKEVARCTSL